MKNIHEAQAESDESTTLKIEYAEEQLERVRQGSLPTEKGIELIKQLSQLRCLANKLTNK